MSLGYGVEPYYIGGMGRFAKFVRCRLGHWLYYWLKRAVGAVCAGVAFVISWTADVSGRRMRITLSWWISAAASRPADDTSGRPLGLSVYCRCSSLEQHFIYRHFNFSLFMSARVCFEEKVRSEKGAAAAADVVWFVDI